MGLMATTIRTPLKDGHTDSIPHLVSSEISRMKMRQWGCTTIEKWTLNLYCTSYQFSVDHSSEAQTGLHHRKEQTLNITQWGKQSVNDWELGSKP